MNYPKKTGFNLYQSQHCNITYRVKTWFLKNLSLFKSLKVHWIIPKKTGFNLCQSRHCAYIAYSVKTCFFKNLSIFKSLKVHWIIPKKTRFQSERIAALCLYNIQRENLVFKKFSLYYTPIYILSFIWN